MKLAKKYNGAEMERILSQFFSGYIDITIDDVIEILKRCTAVNKQESEILSVLVNHIDSFEKRHESIVMEFFRTVNHKLNSYDILSYTKFINSDIFSPENKKHICSFLATNASLYNSDKYITVLGKEYIEAIFDNCAFDTTSNILNGIEIFGEKMIIQKLIYNLRQEYDKKSISGISNKLEFLLEEKVESNQYHYRNSTATKPAKKLKLEICTPTIKKLYNEFKQIDFGQQDITKGYNSDSYYKILEMFRKHIDIDGQDKEQKDRHYIRKIVHENYDGISKQMKKYNISIADAVKYIVAELTENTVELSQETKDQLLGYEVMKVMLK